MARTLLIILTALLGLACLALFAFMKTGPAPSSAPHRPQFGTIQLETAELGEITPYRNGLIAGNANGELCMFPSLSGEGEVTRLSISKSAIVAPVLERNGVCYVGDEDGVFHAYDIAAGKKWSYKTGNKIAGGAVWTGTHILIGSYDQKLYAFDPDSGELGYSVECDSFINGTPVLSADGKSVFLGSCDGIVRKIDTHTGAVIGQVDLDSPIPASPVYFDGVLYAVSHEGRLAAIRVDPFELLYQAECFSSYTSSPYASREFIFLTDTDGKITVHAHKDGKLLSVVEDKETMTPLRAESISTFYAVSSRGKLFQYRVAEAGWTRVLLHDFQTDCETGCQLFGNTLLIADESGGLYYYEVTP